MKKQYTKKQIVEAIKHWESVLKRMDESVYNNVIDALVDEFGKDVALSKEFNYTLTQQDLKKIFSILNKHLFGNEIKFLPVVLWPMSKLVEKLNYHAKMSGDENEEFKNVQCLGVHTAICVPIIDDNNEIIDVKFRDNYLIVNSSKIKNVIFIFAVAVICHEMIHAYDYQYSNETHDLALEWEKNHMQRPDFHNTKIFKNKMNEANDNGINVVTQLSSDESHVVDNIKARFVLKNTINENDKPDLIVCQSEQDILMLNKKTGYGFFAHFD